jgi:hypothetical protein
MNVAIGMYAEGMLGTAKEWESETERIKASEF